MKRLKLALGFLTVIPMRFSDLLQPGALGRAASWYPLVGLLIGGFLVAARFGLAFLFPDPLGAILVVALWAGLTGGLHLDGLADCGDGLLASVSPERRLEIMKDPRLGTFGGVALLLHLLIKIGAVMAISTLPVREALFPGIPGLAFLAPPYLAPLLLAPALARWLIILAARQPMARPGGLGVEFALGVTRRTFFFAALVPLLLVLLGGWRAILAVVFAHLLTAGIIRLARSRLGGMTGDVLGLIVELGESVVLLVFAIG